MKKNAQVDDTILKIVRIFSSNLTKCIDFSSIYIGSLKIFNLKSEIEYR